MNKALYITYQSKIQTLRKNIQICDDWIKKHTQVIRKNMENASRSSSPSYKTQCSQIINARKASIIEYKKRKEMYHRSLANAMRQLNGLR
ncbi:MAG: hypothetical protein PHS44_05065 [Candidatus Dojkabacteria bacterium]|nr:hypothetical protein [Candidatus Dojkabacteria bacterium]